ncbi:MAG TPA: O-antigen ligase family protein [Gemmatimonadaceae bacterium]|nr:O-antigen ligase family protein [Gemmatimonadaceae bacterium]
MRGQAALAVSEPAASTGRRVAVKKRTLLGDPLLFGLVLLIVVTLTKIGGYTAILRAVRPALILFAFCVIYALLNPRRLALPNLQKSLTVILLGAIGVTVVGSAAFGISLGRAATYIIDNFSKTLAITFLLIVAARELYDVRKLTWAFMVAGVILAFLSLFVTGISKVSTGVSYDANDVGVFMAMSLPLALLFVMCAEKKRERYFAIIGIALIAATLAKTQSRGAFLGTIAVGGALLLMPGISVRRRTIFVAAACVTMVVAAPDGYWTAMRSILSDPKADYNWDAVNGRRNLARRGMGYMLSYPAFGVGINNFPMAEGTISDKARYLVRGKGIRWAAPHNSFVQAGAEAGVTGLLLWISLLLTNIVLPLRLSRRIPRSWLSGTPDQRFVAFGARYLPIAQLGFAVTAFFVSFAWLEPLYFFGALIAAFSLIVKRDVLPLVATPRLVVLPKRMRPRPVSPPLIENWQGT